MRRLLLGLVIAGCTAAPPAAPPTAGSGGVTGSTAAINGSAALPEEGGAATNGTANATVADLPQTEAAPPEKDSSLPIYPGAKALGGGQLKLKGKLDSFLATLDYQTPDALAKVVSWYQQKLPKAKVTRLREPGYELVTLQDPALQVTVSRSGAKGPTLVNLVRQQR